jgi:hypothetical protein
LTGK